MGDVSTFWAPAHRLMNRISGGGINAFPPNAAPSLDFLASGIQDHRLPYNKRGSSPVQPGCLGWYGGGDIFTVHYVPPIASAVNVAAAANAVSGTAVTLIPASTGGNLVLSAAAPARFFANPLLQAVGVAIDSLPTYHLFGPASGGGFWTGFYNRATIVGRCVSVTGVAGGTGGNFLISGLDCYGFPLTQLLAATAGATTVNTKKAFKVVTSIVPQFSDAHTYSFGTADIFGIGIQATFYSDIAAVWNNANIAINTGFTAADVTAPATNLTGDVRGTYAVQSASDGTKRLMISSVPSIGLLQVNPTTGLFGQPQV